ncbi:uncharacterized protein PG998_004802 [Apiospora kogelbergensis]|uniref:uncharacterized protein n=1 Tax=Apiospora kogelbergensis TaxID=1337665 RepID=UPI00313297E1
MEHAFENLTPGGWIEYQDSSVDVLSMEEAPKLMTRVPQQMVETFVSADTISNGLKKSVKEIGRVGGRSFYENITGISYKLFKSLGFAEERIGDFTAQYRADLLNPAIHAYFPTYV